MTVMQIADMYFQLLVGGQTFFARTDALKVCVYMCVIVYMLCSTSYNPCLGISEDHIS